MTKIPVADAHCDFLYGMYELGYSIDDIKKKQAKKDDGEFWGDAVAAG